MFWNRLDLQRAGRGMIRVAAGLALLIGAANLSRGADPGTEEGAAFAVRRLNAGLPAPGAVLDRSTPQAALESFLDACRRGDYRSAAHVLDLNAIPDDRQRQVGPVLARQFAPILRDQVWFSWQDLTDRPDGATEVPLPQEQLAGQAGPRRSILLDSVWIGDRDVEIRLERVRVAGAEPAWVFGRRTVQQIPALHAVYGPSRIERSLPAFLREYSFARIALWRWAALLLIVMLGILIGWAVQRLANVGLRRISAGWARALAEALQGPGILLITLLIFHILTGHDRRVAGPTLRLVEPLFGTLLVIGLIWFGYRLIGCASQSMCRRYEGVQSDEASSFVTRVAVARHTLTFLIVIAGILYVMSRFEWFRAFGMTLLASAGVVGVILGIAAQRTLGNLLAGLMLALTQPVRTGDAILFQGEFGWVEEIAFTHIIIRTWDLRRLIVPIASFLDEPVQNWSRRSQQIVKPVYLYADYRIDVDAVREELARVLEESEQWDRSVPPTLEVTDFKEQTVELRALCSAPNPPAAWRLHCFVRERLLAFLRDLDGGRYLPRRRFTRVGDDAPDRDGHRNRPPEADDEPAEEPAPSTR